ncbi:MAG: hypothetical protein IT273_03165 [Chitinophagales bacterium]|nr:hypothetical protein [Chitinophagales bacterium]
MSDTTYITSINNTALQSTALSQLAAKVSVVLRDGTSQEQRLLEALDPKYISVDERDFKDFIAFFHQFAQYIRFYHPNFIADSDWTPFFSLFDGLEKDHNGEKWNRIQKQIENGGMVQPHLSLLITFLHLFKHAQNHLNTLTERHLDYYYREVLRFMGKPAYPDRIHVLVELAKNIDQIIVPKDTLLVAGKDASDADIHYAVERETAINCAQITQLKSLFIDRTTNGHIYRIYAIAQANSADGKGEPLAEEQAFLPFHQGLYTQNSTEESVAQFEATVGFALSSPVLRLQEGKRTIAIEIQFGIQHLNPQHPDYDAQYAEMQRFWANAELFKSNFRISLSTDTGWFNKPIDDIALLPDEGLLTLYTYLSPKDPPVVPYLRETMGGDFPEGEPVLKMQGTPQLNAAFYELFAAYPIQRISIAVAADRTGSLYIQSDLSPVEMGKSFEPFGVQPRQNAAFYVSSPEAFVKQVGALSLDFTWKNLPDHFADYYDEYPTLRNQPFEVALSFLHEQQWLPLVDEQGNALRYRLFVQPNGEQIATNQLRLSLRNVPIPLLPESEPVSASLNNNTQRGYLRIALVSPADAFGHAIYANLYTDKLTDKLFKKSAQMLSMATALPPPSSDKNAAKNNPEADKNQALQQLSATADEVKLPNPPYSPTIEQLSLSYTATQTIRFDKPELNHPKDLFFHLCPFGQSPVAATQGAYLMPNYEGQGQLYIGIEGLRVPQNLSLLFQLAEGSGNPDLALPTIQWHYLNGKQWLPFDRSDILTDTTNNLMNTGMMVFKIPAEASSNNPMMPQNCHWLRLSVSDHILALNQIIAIRAQAISAVFIDRQNDPKRLSQPLAPNSISGLAISDPRIKELIQPYSSFDGKMAEQGNGLYTRVSERLRHKKRAISIWDYERLVLARFNAIYKVKCLPHTSHKSDFAPGCVTLITIPNLRNKNAVNRLQPKTPLNLLKDIKDYIGQFTSPFVRLEVQNPVYEEILVAFDVGFHSGYDLGLYVERLNEAIKQYLSPWAYENSHDIIFGGRIHKSSIINFIEEKEYVDYVNNFVLYHKYREGNDMCEIATDEAEARTARSILVSVEQHRINPHKQGELTYAIPEGIGHMLVEINFEVEDDE